MIDITNFLKKNPFTRKIGNFTKEEMEKCKGKIPHDLFDFLNHEQKSTYGDDFFWTVSPTNYHDIFNNWGLNGNNCFAFLRSSFGCIAYYYHDNYYRLNPHDGSSIIIAGNDLDMLFNVVLSYASNLRSGFYYDLHLKYKSNLPELKEDKMYTLVPALPLGGGIETSKIEIVKMIEQLDILAQLYDHKAKD